MTGVTSSCVFCSTDGGAVVWRDDRLRIVVANEPDWPGFCRVIWHAHVAELTDLDRDERSHVMQAVFATEAALRALLRPDKLNLASLGNVVPHVHWHVIPRWRDDSRFPQPIWAAPARSGRTRVLPPDFVPSLRAMLGQSLSSS